MMLTLFAAMLVYTWFPKVRRFDRRQGFSHPSIGEYWSNGGAPLAASLSFCVWCRVDSAAFSIWDVAACLLAVGLWPVIERLVHKYQMHHIPGVVFDSHEEHHRCPFDATSGITPLAYNGLIVAVAILFWGRPLLSTFLTTLIGLLLFYDWIHYLIHTTHKPTTRWGRAVMANHRRHHFVDHDKYNGLLWPWGDQ